MEKGLALPAPKRPFGQGALLERLNDLIPVAAETAPKTAYLRASVDARDALLAWNESGTIDDSVSPVAPEWEVLDRPVVESFFKNRRSVRHFGPEPIDMTLVYRGIELAAFSPSVCNRQPWKVRLFSGSRVAHLLRHQNGSRGFSEGIPLLALVSVELGYFVGRRERNQAWIDGGIFASSLVWALHGLGLNSCMLNLSITNSSADALRQDARMPSSEVPIMMIAIGNGAKGHRAARSIRRELREILVGEDTDDSGAS
ncbi:nitroreductase family protein [Mycobacterium sp. ZZG]